MTPPIPMGGPFVMPMYRDFVPKAVRPWIYVVFAACFLLTGFFYMGSAGYIVGSRSLMREDVIFIGMCNVIGVNMPFPFLFRFKFRFTNRQLLLTAALGLALCNWLATVVTYEPALCALAFVSGFLKLCGTFECMSNIQLWMTPKRDFSVFFPLLYILVVGDMYLQGWLAPTVTYYCGSWEDMNLLMCGIMLLVAILVFCLTRNFRFMKPMPLVSLDWLGCMLWSLLMMEFVFIFNYGEYFNWGDSTLWRQAVVAFVVTLLLTVMRMRRIRHPYIAPGAFTYKTLLPLLAMFFVAEWLCSTPKVLQNAFTGSVLHWGTQTVSCFELYAWCGNLLGCLFTLLWIKVMRLKYTTLLILGGAAMLAYQVMMYFMIMPGLNIECFIFPIVLRAFGYAIYFTSLTIYLQDIMPFQHFFMGMTITGLMRNGTVGSMMSGLYGYAMRFCMADNAVRAVHYDTTQMLLVSIKRLYGFTCLLGVAFVVILMLYNVQPVRSTLKKMPYWNVLGRHMRQIMRHEARTVADD